MADLGTLSHYTKEGYYVVATTGYSKTTGDERCIFINAPTLEKLRESKELRLAVAKRFKGKRTQYGLPDFLDLIIWCVSCCDYSIRESSINSCTDRDILLAWEFIDTVSVSSSEDTSGVLSSALGNRSSSGFKRCVASQANHLLSTPPKHSTRNRLILQAPSAERASYTHLSLASLIEDDIKAVVGSSSDPLAAAVEIAQFIKGQLK